MLLNRSNLRFPYAAVNMSGSTMLKFSFVHVSNSTKILHHFAVVQLRLRVLWGFF